MDTNKRNTIQRSLVLDAVRSMHTHPTSAEVYEEVRKAHPSISRATVYRNLAVLSETGEICRVQVPGGADHFDFRGDTHCHGICRVCGAVCDVEVDASSVVERHVSDAHGFTVEGYSLVFSGLCEQCAQEVSAS